MKTIKTLKETTDYWKGVPIGTVIAATKEDEIEAIIKNGDGELESNEEELL